MINFLNDPYLLPLIFALLMYLSGLIYAILDGYDLGVGILLNCANDDEKDSMIASIGPFWDANETWLVLTIGILLVAFPYAQGAILTSMYAPLVTMLIALVVRGAAFDFRTKTKLEQKNTWNNAFFAGSLTTSLAQGYMLALYMVGAEISWQRYAFAIITSITLTMGYALIGASWLIMKTEDCLQLKAISWAKKITLVLVPLIITILMLYPVTRHLMPKFIPNHKNVALIIIAFAISITILLNYYILRKLPCKNDALCWLPFAMTTLTFLLCGIGLVYSFYPYLTIGGMTIWNAASSQESLWIIFLGVLVVLPLIIIYNIVIHKSFWGKTGNLRYY
ncbi:cytochrome bd ubiquinol oxidase subunit II [Candidatus Xenohaliotis californiensis]|uniref:Cytochrome bd ubiquinol oxidase subunit II n=1 Tax=Candidatus Xenohaliotis californiensis TaxID=84677 RepID=A0ABP0EVC1_9RICK|nr:cytochrome bd ubiquinol oxidase subunit II [Candidatus Xenohaliotis californiensis]